MRPPTNPWLVCLALASVALGARGAGAQVGGGYDLTWNSLDCGATTSTAGGYALAGTIAQPDAGSLSGGAYGLSGGFRSRAGSPTAAPPDATFDAGSLLFRLHANAPNPFQTTTAIAFSLRREEGVELRVYDLAGRLVRTVLDRRMGAGRHQAVWDGSDDAGRRAAHGIYLLRLKAGEFEAQRKLVLMP